jgi:hypothetical protein
LILFSQFAYAQTENCLETINEIVKNQPAHKDKLQEFLKIQAGLTMHKLAYATLRDDHSKDKFRLENEIIQILSTMQDKRQDQDFEHVYQMYHHPKNKLSRTALAEVLPHIQNILNDQIEEDDPFKRKHFLINQADIQLLAILAEKEKKYQDGSYAQTLSANKASDQSILNFVKIINSSIQNTAGDVAQIKASLLNRLEGLTKQAQALLQQFGLGPECESLDVTSCENHSDKAEGNIKTFDALLLAINKQDDLDKQKYLRYGDVWLYTKSSSKKLSDAEVKPSVTQNATIPVIKPQVLKVKEKTDDEIILDYLVDHVLDHMPYFFTKEELLKDAELTYALARAIDEGVLAKKSSNERLFFYKGKPYQIPELWNSSYSESVFGINASRFGKDMNQFIFTTFQEKDLKIKIPSNVPASQHQAFLSKMAEQQQKFNHQMSFEFKGKLYNVKTGALIPKAKNSIFLFPYKGEDIKEKNYSGYSAQDKKLIVEEIIDGNRAFIKNNKALHISGVPVSFDKEYARAKKHFETANAKINKSAGTSFVDKKALDSYLKKNPSFKPAVLKGLADRNKVVASEDDILDIHSLKLVNKDQAIKIIVNHRNQLGLNRSPAHFQGFDGKYVKGNAVAIMNNKPTFKVDGKTYHTDSGKAQRAEVPTGSPFKGMIDHSTDFAIRNNRNSQSDLTIISEHHHRHGLPKGCESYTIIDKSTAKLKVLNKDKQLLFETEVLLGKEFGDERTRIRNYEKGETNNKTGAGIYSFAKQDELGLIKNPEDFAIPPIMLKGSDGKQSVLTLAPVAKSSKDRYPNFNNGSLQDNYVTNGGVVLTNAQMQRFNSFVKIDCPLYVLPGQGELKFKEIEGQLVLQPKNQSQFSNSKAQGKKLISDFNITDNIVAKPKAIKMKITDPRFDAPLTQKYVQTLEKEKANLMASLGLTNDEYNELAKMAFGVLGVESGFGTEKAYKIKEKKVLDVNIGQWIVDYAKGNTFMLPGQGIPVAYSMLIDNSGNSRGLTQIKNVKSYLKEKYPHINDSNLNEPQNAAIATMFVLASKLQTLKKIEGQHSAITDKNRTEYLYYLYMGSSEQIINGTATPKLNPRASEVKAYSEQISLFTTP